MFSLPLLLFFIKINIEVVRTRVRVWVRDYTRYPVGMGMRKKFDTR